MPRLLPLSLAFALCLGVAACGKRGPLEPPPGQTQAREAAKAEAKAKEAAESGLPGETQPAATKLGTKKRVPITPPKRDLIIDGILE